MLSRSIDAQCSFTDNVSHGSGRSCTADPSPKYQDDQHTPLSQFIPCWGWIPGLCMSKQSALSYSLLSESILKLQFCALPQIYLIRVSGQGPGICSPEAYPGLCMCKQVVGMEWAAQWLVVSYVPEFPGPPASSWLVFRVSSKLPDLFKYSSVPIFYSGYLQRLQVTIPCPESLTALPASPDSHRDEPSPCLVVFKVFLGVFFLNLDFKNLVEFSL